MRERTFEDILVKYPDLIEDGLTLLDRQYRAYGRIMDLVFRDAFNRELIVELKAGAITDKAIGQILTYEGMLLSGENPTIRVMLIATRVPPNIRRSLDHHGIAWKEITVQRLKEYLNEKGDSTLLADVEGAERLAPVPILPNHEETKKHRSPPMSAKKSDSTKKSNVIIPYGTARKNFRNFVPLQKIYVQVNDKEKRIPDAYFEVDGIIFSRMSTAYSKDGIEYEVRNPYVHTDVPILVSIQNVKLYKPVQIIDRHVGVPNWTTGGPSRNSISDDQAKELMGDAIEVNPNLKDELEAIHMEFFGSYTCKPN
jgi:hypothetical protein